jgi:hypothetical protein
MCRWPFRGYSASLTDIGSGKNGRSHVNATLLIAHRLAFTCDAVADIEVAVGVRCARETQV